MNCLGIDPSLSGTAIYNIVNFNPKKSWLIKTEKKIFKEKDENIKKKSKKMNMEEILEKMERHYTIYKQVRKILFDIKPDYIGIESYSFLGMNLAQQAEVNGVLSIAITNYRMNCKKDIKVIFFTPQSLKKYILGKAGGGKDLILKEVYKKYNLDVNDNNIADAFVLGLMTNDFAYFLNKKKYRNDIKQYQKEIFENNFFIKQLKLKG